MSEDLIKQVKAKFGDRLILDEPMSRHATIGIGGPAKFYVEAKEIDDLIYDILVARSLPIDYRVIGGGSNVLFSDKGFDGLVIVNKTNRIAIDPETNHIICDSGVPLVRLIVYAASQNLGGMEALYGIPGTVGGAIYGNAGAHGVEIKDYLKSITVITPNGKLSTRPVTWLEPAYRETKLKREQLGSDYTVLVGRFKFTPRKSGDIQRDINKFRNWRAEHQPLSEKTTGSVFRNPSGSSAGDKEQSAGWLLEQIGAKKLRIGKAEITKMHSNWIRNIGGAKAEDVKNLIDKLKLLAKQEYGIDLKEEIELVGSWQ
jgi:UDP-N-acetylmuramate dehydrogenase